MATKREIEYYEANKELIDKATLEGVELAGQELVKSNILRHYVATCLTDRSIFDGISSRMTEYDEKVWDIVSLSINSLLKEGKLVPNEKSTLREPLVAEPKGFIEPKQKKLYFAITTALDKNSFIDKVMDGNFAVENNEYIDTKNCLLQSTCSTFLMKKGTNKAACALPNRVCGSLYDNSTYQTIFEMEMECNNGIISGDVHNLMEITIPDNSVVEEFGEYEPPADIVKGGNLGYCEANYLAAYGVAPVLKSIEPHSEMIISTDKNMVNAFIREHRKQMKTANLQPPDKEKTATKTRKK